MEIKATKETHTMEEEMLGVKFYFRHKRHRKGECCFILNKHWTVWNKTAVMETSRCPSSCQAPRQIMSITKSFLSYNSNICKKGSDPFHNCCQALRRKTSRTDFIAHMNRWHIVHLLFQDISRYCQTISPRRFYSPSFVWKTMLESHVYFS